VKERIEKKVGPAGPEEHTQDSSTRFGVNKTFADESPSHEKVLSDISNNNNIDIKSIHTYNTYNTYSQLKDVQASERRHPFTTTYSPTIYREFRKAVHLTQPYHITPNRVLEDFMIDYIVRASKDQKQPKITQFFINKPQQVNIAKEQVIVQKPRLNNINYSELSLKELQDHYDKARALNQMGKIQTIAYELKKRGITP